MNTDLSISQASTAPTSADLFKAPSKTEGLSTACDQFEGILVRQILSEGLKPLLAKPLGSGATGSGVYDFMVTNTLANGVAGKNAMGISHLLQAQLAPHTAASAPSSKP